MASLINTIPASFEMLREEILPITFDFSPNLLDDDVILATEAEVIDCVTNVVRDDVVVSTQIAGQTVVVTVDAESLFADSWLTVSATLSATKRWAMRLKLDITP